MVLRFVESNSEDDIDICVEFVGFINVHDATSGGLYIRIFAIASEFFSSQQLLSPVMKEASTEWNWVRIPWAQPRQMTSFLPMTMTTTTVYFNNIVFPSVLGSTSPMAFPQHFPPPWPVPSIFPTKSLRSHIFSQHFSPSLGSTFHSITIYLQCLNSL